MLSQRRREVGPLGDGQGAGADGESRGGEVAIDTYLTV
jgi:hypothetical protein